MSATGRVSTSCFSGRAVVAQDRLSILFIYSVYFSKWSWVCLIAFGATIRCNRGACFLVPPTSRRGPMNPEAGFQSTSHEILYFFSVRSSTRILATQHHLYASAYIDHLILHFTRF